MRKTELEQEIAGYFEQRGAYPVGHPEYVRISGEIDARQAELRQMEIDGFSYFEGALSEKLTLVQNAIREEKQKGFAKDFIFISDLETAEAEILKLMDEEAVQLKAERVETAKEEAEQYIKSDDAWADVPQSVIDLVQMVVEKAVKDEQEQSAKDQAELIAKYTARIDVLTKQGLETEDQLTTAKEEIARITDANRGLGDGAIAYREEIRGLQHDNEVQLSQIVRLVFERDEALEVRDNAAQQLEEAKKEVDRLRNEITDYQTAKVFGEREAQKTIQVQADEAIKEQIAKVNREFKLINGGLYPQIEDAEGNKETVHQSELASLNIVPEFTAQTVDLTGVDISGTFQPETVHEAEPADEPETVEGSGSHEGHAEEAPTSTGGGQVTVIGSMPSGDNDQQEAMATLVQLMQLEARVEALENSYLRLE